MRHFSGDFNKARKVDLRGKSKGEESREKVLERTRHERERRRQQKLEQQAATTIQACFRSWSISRKRCEQLRQAWDQQFSQTIRRDDLNLGTPCIPGLLAFFNPMPSGTTAASQLSTSAIADDVVRLSRVCRALLMLSKQQDGTRCLLPVGPVCAGQQRTTYGSGTKLAGQALPVPGPDAMDVDPVSALPPFSQHVQQYRHAVQHFRTVSQLVFTLAKVASCCMRAVHAVVSSPEAQQRLTGPRPCIATVDNIQSLDAISVMIETLLWLVSPDAWTWLSNANLNSSGAESAAETWTAQSAAAAVVAKIVLGTTNIAAVQNEASTVSQSSRRAQDSKPGLFRTLGRMLCMLHSSSFASRSYAEQITTQLCVRALALKQRSGAGLLLELQHPSHGAQHLLCVADLWTRCPSLKPITKHLTKLSAGTLAKLPTGQLAWSPGQYLLGKEDGCSFGEAEAAVNLLSNLAAGGANVLATPPQSLTPEQVPGSFLAARSICGALTSLLHILPSELLPSSSTARSTSTRTGSALGSTSVASHDHEDEAASFADMEATYSRCQFGGSMRSSTSSTSQSSSAAGAVQNSSTISKAMQNSSSAPERLPLPCDELVPVEMIASVQSLRGPQGRQLLHHLIQHMLPYNSNACTAPFSQLPALQESAVHLCKYINQLGLLSSNKQQVYMILAMSTDFIARLWFSVVKPLRISEITAPAFQGNSSFVGAPGSLPAQSVIATGSTTQDDLTLLLMFCNVFTAHVSFSPVEDLYNGQPLPLTELYDSQQPQLGFLAALKDRLWALLWTNTTDPSSTKPSGNAAAASSAASTAGPAQALQQQVQDQLQQSRKRVFVRTAGALYCSLYDRSSGGGGAGRKTFAPASAFHASSLGPERFAQEAAAARISMEDPYDTTTVIRRPGASRTDLGARIWQVLRFAPALVPFEERARFFQSEAESARREYRDSELRAQAEALQREMILQPKHIQIRRSNMLFDGFDKVGDLGPDAMKGRVRVTFMDDEGEAEAGVDGGGLFKDFLEGVIKEGFGGTNGLFKANAQNELYPNSAAHPLVPEALQLWTFLGRMLGKALWEGILLELPLARFFLKKLRGGWCDLRDLPSLDQQLYNNLLSLKSYKGDLSELSLTFTATREIFDRHEEVELKRGGKDIPVTADNLGEYIALVADYRLNREPGLAVTAFVSGLHEMVRPEWLGLFNETELQMLISGRSDDAQGGVLDIADLQQYTHYQGGYHEDHPVIHTFWDTMATLNASEQHAFLKFVTACSRAPLLGFQYLEPQLCISMAGSMLDPSCVQRLPTAATCLNLLKLPPYRDVHSMREKLLLAITGAHTFDLS